MPKKRKKSSMSDYKNNSTYDPEIHTKTKGGYGFGMKRNAKELEYESSGVKPGIVIWRESP